MVEEQAKEAKTLQKVVANIAGNDYSLVGEESEEHLLGIAAMVDSKMLELKRKHPRQNVSRIAILTALQLADEYVKLSDEYDKLMQELDKMTE